METTALSTSAHAGHFDTTAGELPWSTIATILAAALSAPVFAYLADRCGRKSGIYVVSLMQGVSKIIYILYQVNRPGKRFMFKTQLIN